MIDFNRTALRRKIITEVLAATRVKDLSRLDTQLTIATEQYFLEIAENIRGHKDFLQNNFPDSLHHINEAIRLNPSFADSHYHKAIVLLAMENYEEAIKSIDYALQNLFLLHFSNFYVAKGVAFDRLGLFDEAIFCFLRAIEDDENNEQPYKNLLSIMIRKKASLEILSISQKIGEKFAKNPDLLDWTSIILLQQADQYFREGNKDLSDNFLQEADKQLHIAVRQDPENSSLLYNLACLYSRSSRLEEALDTLKKAFEKAAPTAEKRRLQQLAREDTDFENIRKEPRFLQLLNVTQ